ncbi:MrcB family domain-containing protein [Paracoccus sp. SM22M-07]|uniref:MrcB family domain-containing protein n=1 Tax=Paracoccus sp. SM22M-07 TaxID=1520813 RepID=UPI00093054B6|nr:DUF3578 domain-containing protein [Paracoccus sp. SM22M-07]
MVHRRAIPPRAEIQALRARAPVRRLRPRRDGGRAAGLSTAPDDQAGLATALSLTARRFVHERQRPYAGSPFARFFRQDVARMGRDLVAPRPERLMVRASVGAQGWASVPWLAFFAPHVTRSMRQGLYVVFLINARDERVILSLQHGAGAALTQLGPDQADRHLRHMAATTRRAVTVQHEFDEDPIKLGSTAALPLAYQSGCTLSRSWAADDLTDDALSADLTRMLDIYRGLVPPA